MSCAAVLYTIGPPTGGFKDHSGMLLLLAVQALVASALRLRFPGAPVSSIRALSMQLEAVGSGNLCRIKVTTFSFHATVLRTFL